MGPSLETKYERWYLENRPLYESLAEKVKSLMEEILESKNIDYYIIQARAKSTKSFSDKVTRIRPKKPDQIDDLAGIRIIGYVLSDIDKITEIINKNFDTDEKGIDDKSEILGIDKVGYKSRHFVSTIPKARIAWPEFQKFNGLHFEIQVRTILQHAWAEIQHDRNYKFSGVLPKEIQRTFNLLAGTLELIDNQFEQMSKQIGEYMNEVSNKTKTGDLEIPINSTSLMQYMIEKFGDLRDIVSLELIDELNSMNIKTLHDLDKILPANLRETYQKVNKDREKKGMSPISFAGLIRAILWANDTEGYFKTAWKNQYIYDGDENEERFLRNLGIDTSIINKYAKGHAL